MRTDAKTVPESGDAPDLQSRREWHRRDEARRKVWRVAIVSAIFAVLISANLFVGGIVLVSTLRSDDAKKVAASQVPTGRVMQRLPDGTHCRFTTFDNKLGQAIEDKVTRCDAVRQQDEDKRPIRFNWGGK